MTDEVKNKIHDLAVQQIIADFESIKDKSYGESIYGFGLGLVGDITGFFSAGNSIESLQRTLAAIDDTNDISPYWLISEWEYEGTNDNTLYEFLATFIYDIEEGKHDKVLKDYENVLIKALKTCDKNGVFGKGKERDELIVYLHYADATDEDIDDVSSEQINPPVLHNLFKKRWSLNPGEKSLTKIIKSKMDLI